MGRHGHRGGRKHRDRSADGEDSPSSSEPLPPPPPPLSEKRPESNSVMSLLSSALPTMRSAHSRGGSGPLWKNDQVHVWRKDNVTIINMRNEKEHISGVDAVLRQLEKQSSASHGQHATAGRNKEAVEANDTSTPTTSHQSTIPMPRNGVPRTSDGHPGNHRSEEVVGPRDNVQAYLTQQLSRMHAKDYGVVPSAAVSRLSGPPPPPPPPTSTTAYTAPQPAATLFHDPMWSSSAWDAFDQKSKRPDDAPNETDLLTLDVLSGILGDLRSSSSTETTPAASSKPVATSSATVGPSVPAAIAVPSPAATFTAQTQPIASGWTVAAPGATLGVAPTVAQGPVAGAIKHPGIAAQPMQQVFMGPNGVSYVAYASPQGFAGFPQGVMAGQPMMYPQGMQIVQVPQTWAMAGGPLPGQPAKAMVASGFQLPPGMAPAKPMTLEEYNRLIQGATQPQRSSEAPPAGSGFTVVSGGSEPNRSNASANGVNIGARPFVPPRQQ